MSTASKVSGDNKYFMSGVDKHDLLFSKYSTSIRGNKSYCLSFARLIDLAIIIAWIIHKFVLDKKYVLNLVDFKLNICLAYIKQCN